jgi:hypothetical protein
MRRCPHTGLSTRFRLSGECDRCRAEDAERTWALFALLNPSRWFRRRVTSWPRPIGRPLMPAQIRDGGVGVPVEEQTALSLVDVNSIADLMRWHARHTIPAALAQNNNGARALSGYADTIRK